MDVGVVAAQLGAVQACRGGGSREGKKETQEFGARGVMRVEVVVGKSRRRRRRGDGDRVRWGTVDGRDAQHVFVVVCKGGDEVGVGVLVCGGCSQLAVECVRPSLRAWWHGRLWLGLQLPLGAGSVYEVEAATKTVHTLAHVIQRHRKLERAAWAEVCGGWAEQGEPVSLFGLFGGW